MKNTLFFFPKPLFVPIANNFSLYIYNLSYLLLSFTKYKYTVYTGMYFHQNTSYQTQSFPYQTTTQWWNRAKRRRSARDPRPQVLPSHADPPPPSVDSSNPMNNSKYLLAPWNTWRRKQNRKESNTTSKPKVPEFLRGIKHQTNIVENSQFYKNFQKVSTKGGKCTSTPPELYTENPQYSDNKRNRLPAFNNANTVQWSSKTLHTSNQPQGTKSRPQDHPVKRDLSGIHMKTLPKPPMSTLENLAPEPLRFAQNIPNNTHKVRIWKIGPHADQTACHMPRRLITNKPCFCLSQKILPTVTPRRGFHSTHSASISYSWDIYSYHITQSTPTRAHLLTLTPHRGLHSAHNARISTSWDMYSNHIKNKYFIKSSELSTSWALAHPSSLKPHPTLSISHHCSSDPLPSFQQSEA